MESETYFPSITHGGTEYGGKLCKCNECGIEEICTPFSDFYTTCETGPSGPLLCEGCFMAWVSNRKSRNAS